MRHAGSLRGIAHDALCNCGKQAYSSGEALAIIVAPDSARQPHESTA